MGNLLGLSQPHTFSLVNAFIVAIPVGEGDGDGDHSCFVLMHWLCVCHLDPKQPAKGKKKKREREVIGFSEGLDEDKLWEGWLGFGGDQVCGLTLLLQYCLLKDKSFWPACVSG